jgi:NAD+ kinase
VGGYRSVGVVANPRRAGVPEAVGLAVAWLRGREREVRVAPDVREALQLDIPAFQWEDLASQVDLLLTFGGDGTILFAARHLRGQQVPIFGVNTGSLGFLTSSSRESMLKNFDLLFAGAGEESPYMTLEAELLGAGAPEPRQAAEAPASGRESAAAEGYFTALNDVVLHKGAVTARVLDLRLEVDGDEVGTYVADGLILSTPLGSSGYALSAHGPLVVPTMEAIVATPICPHTLAVRPLVLPPGADIRVTVLEEEERSSLAVDGRVVAELGKGEGVRVTRAVRPVLLVRLPGRSFFRLLRSKLHWGERASGA